MLRFLILGIGGAAGAISRYLLDGWVQGWTNSVFPWGILTVNLAGCFILGLLATLADERFLWSPTVRMGLFVGFIGAFTTFSTFIYDSWNLLKESQYFLAGLNVALSLVGGFLGLGLGVFFAKIF